MSGNTVPFLRRREGTLHKDGPISWKGGGLITGIKFLSTDRWVYNRGGVITGTLQYSGYDFAPDKCQLVIFCWSYDDTANLCAANNTVLSAIDWQWVLTTRKGIRKGKSFSLVFICLFEAVEQTDVLKLYFLFCLLNSKLLAVICWRSHLDICVICSAGWACK